MTLTSNKLALCSWNCATGNPWHVELFALLPLQKSAPPTATSVAEMLTTALTSIPILTLRDLPAQCVCAFLTQPFPTFDNGHSLPQVPPRWKGGMPCYWTAQMIYLSSSLRMDRHDIGWLHSKGIFKLLGKIKGHYDSDYSQLSLLLLSDSPMHPHP